MPDQQGVFELLSIGIATVNQARRVIARTTRQGRLLHMTQESGVADINRALCHILEQVLVDDFMPVMRKTTDPVNDR